MHMLYDSDSFVVVHMLPDTLAADSAPGEAAPALAQMARHGF